MRADTFRYVADLVRLRSAIQLEAGKEYLVESRLGPLARRVGSADIDALVDAVRAAPDGPWADAVVEALTTNETSWFRDAQPFDALIDIVVPSLVEQRTTREPLRFWSAACSSGQEPYSIAMTMAQNAPHVEHRILATDLSREMVERTRLGQYTQLEMNRGLPVTHLLSHFTRRGASWEINEEMRSRVDVRQHNLLDQPPWGGPFDVVFLRNVLIYFDLETKRDILRKVQKVLRPGGFLLLGAAETTIGIDDAWSRVPTGRGSIYQASARRAA